MSNPTHGVLFAACCFLLVETCSLRAVAESTQPAAPSSHELAGMSDVYAIGELNDQPRALTRVPPEYPASLRQAGVTGVAVIDFIVNKEGEVVNASVVRSSNELMAKAALTAVEQWRFRPGSKDGRPVNTHMQVPIVFSLNADAGHSAPAKRGLLAGMPIYSVAEVSVPPVPKRRVPPQYPADLHVRGITGEALIEFVVAADGSVANAQVAKATRPQFGTAAVDAVARWQFIPAQRDGARVNCRMSVPIVFNLSAP